MIKVVVGVHAVMASGGVTGSVWLNMVALAARKHAVLENNINHIIGPYLKA